MDIQKHLNEIEEIGFSIIPNIISAEEAKELKKQIKLALDEEWREFGGRQGKIKHLAVDLLAHGGAFAKLLENDLMHEVFSHFLGDNCILYCFNSAIMPPEQKTSACEIHVDQNIWIPDYTSRILMTLAIDDFTVDKGATYHLPRSHKMERPPSEEEFYKNAVRVVRKAGDAVFFNPRCWHAGAVNHTGETRYGIGIQACQHFMKQRIDYPNFISQDIVAQLSERSKRFVGLNSIPPKSLDEFYLPEEERLYKPYH